MLNTTASQVEWIVTPPEEAVSSDSKPTIWAGDAADPPSPAAEWLGEYRDLPNRESFLRDWIDLEIGAPTGNIYLHPEMVLGVPDDAAPLVYARRKGAQAEAAPLACLAALAAKTKRVRLMPGLPLGLSLRGRRLIGNQLLGDEGQASAAAFVQALARWLGASGTRCDFVLFEDIESESALWQALQAEAARGAAAVFYLSDLQPHWWIQFPQRPEEYWKQFSAKTRETLRRKAKKLDHSVTCFTEKKSVAEFLEKAHQVSKNSWQAKRLGVRIRNTSEERVHYECLASQGALRSYVLEQNGCPLAFEVGVQWKGRHILEETGYDADYAHSSPGTVLLFRILQDLIARDTPRFFDFGFGDAEYKRIFANHQTTSGPVLLLPRRLRPILATWVERLRRGVSRGLRAASNGLRILPVLRRLYRQ